ncbi:MAG: metallophosphoesterase family protein, partial [Dehalococcoidia bacterium]|nr:metallophosphoesterase family protein [Dehalococcoidia bacterium]
MRIGVVSDTHVTELSEMAAPILAALTKVDLIVHAGDFTGKA